MAHCHRGVSWFLIYLASRNSGNQFYYLNSSLVIFYFYIAKTNEMARPKIRSSSNGNLASLAGWRGEAAHERGSRSMHASRIVRRDNDGRGQVFRPKTQAQRMYPGYLLGRQPERGHGLECLNRQARRFHYILVIYFLFYYKKK